MTNMATLMQRGTDMSNCPFCNLDSSPDSMTPPREQAAPRKKNFLRRIRLGIKWLFPTTLMVLMPKCPMCLAAYIALFTGLELSFTTARWLYITLWAFCILSLSYLFLKLTVTFIRNYHVNRTRHAR